MSDLSSVILPVGDGGTSRAETVRELEREPLRNVVLLKHLAAFPDRTTAHRVTGKEGSATLVLVGAEESAYDRDTYPDAAWVALVGSDHPTLTARLIDHVPRGAGVVFKLSADGDRDAVAARFAVEPQARFLSYTARDGARFDRDPEVLVMDDPGDDAMALFEAQGHARGWLRPLLAAGVAFACILHGRDGRPASVCFAFENHGRVWEVGGVFTPGLLRGQGLARRAVQTALAVLRERGLAPRYQVDAGNRPSIALAEGIGLRRFLTISHYLHVPPAVASHGASGSRARRS